MTTHNKPAAAAPLRVLAETGRPMPLFISAGNAEALTGNTFRWCRDAAQRLGVPLIRASKHKHFIRADLFVAALERGNVTVGLEKESPAIVDCADPVAAILKMLGKRLVVR